MKRNILLLQARTKLDPAKPEEVSSFANKAGLSFDSIKSHDLLTGPPNIDDLKNFDAMMIGGSGEYFVSKQNLPGFGETLAFLTQVVEIGMPTFASCFGFQLLSSALGGRVIHDPEQMELGTHVVTGTTEAEVDELFSFLPSTYNAQLGHKDRVSILPEGVILLGYSARCPYQAFRIPGKPIWAVQFHPELSSDENEARYKRYMKQYAPVLGTGEEKSLNFLPSPETEQMISRFLRLVL